MRGSRGLRGFVGAVVAVGLCMALAAPPAAAHHPAGEGGFEGASQVFAAKFGTLEAPTVSAAAAAPHPLRGEGRNMKLVANVPVDFGSDLELAGDYAYVGSYGEGMVVIDISRPRHPKRAGLFDCPGGQNDIQLSPNGKYAVMAIETRDNACHPATAPNGLTQPKKAGIFNIRYQPNTNPLAGCPIHVFWQAPDQNRLTTAWYGRGTRVVDFSNPADARQLAYFIPEGADTWASKPHNGFIFTGDINRGFDVLKYTGPGWPATSGPAQRDRKVQQGAVRCAGLKATRIGTPTADTIRGTKRRDVIAGLAGRDIVRGVGGNDRVCGGGGDDRIRGGAGDDRLFGQRGADIVKGGAGRDFIRGGKGADGVSGGRGRDDVRR